VLGWPRYGLLYVVYRVFWHLGRTVSTFLCVFPREFRRAHRDSQGRRNYKTTNQPSGHPAALSKKHFIFLGCALVAVLGLWIFTHTKMAQTAPRSAEALTELLKGWPGMFGVAFVLWIAVKVFLGDGPSLIVKPVKVVASVIVLMALGNLLAWKPLWSVLAPLGVSEEEWSARLFTLALAAWGVSFLWVVFSKPKGRRAVASQGSRQRREQPMWSNIPKVNFSDVGGMESAKQQIRAVVENRLDPGKYSKYGVVQNGILLHGPRGSGKTYLAEATAGEFGINFYEVSSPKLLDMWVGTTGKNIRDVFTRALAYKPIVLFIDEIDTLGSGRQVSGSDGDPGGAGREFNTMVNQLMQSIDHYRNESGLILMAATNFLDGLDPALIREGRFDVRIRVGLPDKATRRKIFETQLAKKPWKQFPLEEFARKTPGASAARIRALVDRAAAMAAEQRRKIVEQDLRKAFEEAGGGDRPLFKPVEWKDVVIPPEVERDLRSLIKLLEPGYAERVGLEAPTGVLLIGPPGTGKTMIARLLATETGRSFYPITAADVLGGVTGASVKKLSEVFNRAKEHSPSIVFLDEMDGLLPRNSGYLNQHDVQLVEQCLIEISQLEPEHNVLLVGTTNHIGHIDPRVLRGGRFSEKIEIGVPSAAGYNKLLRKYLRKARFDRSLTIEQVAERMTGISPADLEAICSTAKRFAMHRMAEDAQELPPLVWDDFERAIERVQVRF